MVTLSFTFLNATAKYDSASGITSVTLFLNDTGSVSLPPKDILNQVPPGTSLVSGTWIGYFYSSNGSFICYVPMGCKGTGPPDTSNGGTVKVVFEVTGATAGEVLTLDYTFSANGLTASHSLSFTVA